MPDATVAELTLADLMRDWEQTDTATKLYDEVLTLLDSDVSNGAMDYAADTVADSTLAVRLQKADVRFNLGGLLRETGDHVGAVAEYNAGLLALGISAETDAGGEHNADDNGYSVDSSHPTDTEDHDEHEETVSAAIVERVAASQSQLLMARGLSTAKLGDGRDLENIEAGLEDLRGSLALQPRAVTHNAMGNVLKSAGRDAEAELCYSKALDLDEGYAVAHYNLGSLLHKQGKLEEASVSLHSSISLDPEYSLPVVALGDIAVGRGDIQTAVGHWATAYKLTPKHQRVKEVPRSLAKLGLRMARGGGAKLRDAKLCLETAHDLKPPKTPMTAAPELLAAKPYATEITRALRVIKKKGTRTPEKCAKHKTCEKCRKAACAWCVGRESCELDEQMVCDNPKGQDHIGIAGPVGQLECPSSP